MTINEESKLLAQEFIDAILRDKKLDYSEHFETIIHDIENYVFDAHWDHTIYFDNLPSIRIIQEDEYDQSMDEEDKPNWEYLLQVGSHYLLVG